MSAERLNSPDPRQQAALDELRGRILQRYPDAQFEVTGGIDDPNAIHLVATVDVEDTEDVVDLVIDRMMELQIEQGLPIFVIPVRPVERVIASLNAERPLRSRLGGAALIP
jgi:hypothetical protein